MTEPLPLRTQMKFKRGFSDPNFVAGGTSEFDRAVETGAKALEWSACPFDPLGHLFKTSCGETKCMKCGEVSWS